jgi:hypothetical protein
MRHAICLLFFVACGARTELGAPGMNDAGIIADVHVVIDAHPVDAHVVDVQTIDASCVVADITGTARITTDDNFGLYVNDVLVDDTPRVWSDAQQYTVTIHRDPSRRNTIAIQGTNLYNTDGRDRGVILDLRFDTEAGEQTVVTDGQWRLATSVNAQWYEASFDDSSWQNAFSEGPYGEGPWFSVFSQFGIDSQAEWLWSYDSNKPSSAKVMQEVVYVRRDFYVDASGHVSGSPSACK